MGERRGGRREGPDGGRAAGDRSKGGTITSDRSIIDSGGATRSISVQLCPYQYPDSFMKDGGDHGHVSQTLQSEGMFSGGGEGRGVHRSRTRQVSDESEACL